MPDSNQPKFVKIDIDEFWREKFPNANLTPERLEELRKSIQEGGTRIMQEHFENLTKMPPFPPFKK